MATVSNTPFALRLIKKFPVLSIQTATNFSDSEDDIWMSEFITLSAEENEEIEMYFNSSDGGARLYLDALDIMPEDDKNVVEDEDGRIYRTVSGSKFTLYKSNAGYDALRVDTFKISVFCYGKWFYGIFEIRPKPISMDEWHMMKDDLELEIKRFTQDIFRHNTGIGNYHSEAIPSKVLYAFLVIKKYSKKVLPALMDISNNPRNEIRIKNREKTIFYDIQDNRLLKMIIAEYEKKLNQFIDMIDDAGKSWKNELPEFKEAAVKLRKLTAILKSQNWYSKIKNVTVPYVPHSFILDTRYNLMYQMYLDLKRDEIRIELNSKFSYTWKRSSYLYEMWCFLKICHIMLSQYSLTTVDWKFIFSDKVLFPFLEEGTKIEFEDSNIRIDVIYDKPLPIDRAYISEDNPLFIARHYGGYRTHNRPDIVINVYNKSNDWYMGTVILECKYRKLSSFWQENSTWSSRRQLESYYNDARSPLLFGNRLGEQTERIRPVTKVFVLTPDDLGEGKGQQEFGIVIKGFKASNTTEREDSLKNDLFYEIEMIQSFCI